MDSLFSADGLAELGNNILNKLSDAVGWVVTHDTPNRIALQTFIHDIQNSNYDPITKAVLISNAKKLIKEHRNQSVIVSNAIQVVKTSARIEDVDNEWLSQFMDKARLVSDSEFQILWSYILAEEFNTPGCIPRSLLHIIEQMDKDMAKQFMSIAAVSVYVDEGNVREYYPIIWANHMSDYKTKFGITIDSLVDLQSIGLIEAQLGPFASGFSISVHSKPASIHYFDQTFCKDNENDEFAIGNVVFTKAGNALCRAVKVKKIEGFFNEYCITQWKKRGN